MDNKYDKWGHSELISERKKGKKERKSFLNQKEEWRKNFGNSLQFMLKYVYVKIKQSNEWNFSRKIYELLFDWDLVLLIFKRLKLSLYWQYVTKDLGGIVHLRNIRHAAFYSGEF